MKTQTPLRLLPQLVPKPLWGMSAYRKIDRGSWQRIRQDALKAAGQRCEICGVSPLNGPLTCHEVWQYDDGRKRATLDRLEIHCTKCDTATHMGRAFRHGQGEVALEQLSLVNGITRREARQIYSRAIIIWKQRNTKTWRVAVEEALVRRYPCLAVLEDSG